MALPITTLLAGILGVLLFVLSARVVRARQQASSIDNGEALIQRRMRGQANLIEYAPLTLILFALAELQGLPLWALGILAALFAFARIIHGVAFAFSDHWPFGRFYGTLITFSVLAIMSAITVVMGLGSLMG